MRARQILASCALVGCFAVTGCFGPAFGAANQPTPIIVGEPQVSPDGSNVAYIHNIDGDFDIWLLPLAGGVARNLTDNDVPDADPSWLPDGSGIVFSSHSQEGGWQLYRMNADGSDRRQISSFPAP